MTANVARYRGSRARLARGERVPTGLALELAALARCAPIETVDELVPLEVTLPCERRSHQRACVSHRDTRDAASDLVITRDVREHIARSRGDLREYIARSNGDLREYIARSRCDLHERSGCARPVARRKSSAQRRVRAMVGARAPPRGGMPARPLAEPTLLEELAMPALPRRRRPDVISTPPPSPLDPRSMLHPPSKLSLRARRSAEGAELHLDARGWPAIAAVVMLSAGIALLRWFL